MRIMHLIERGVKKIQSYYSRTERELRRIQDYPRYKNGKTFLSGGVEFTDSLSFLGGYDDIFLKRKYLFKCETDNPFIIDGGANIGMAIIFYKLQFPNAKILAFEPDPQIFKTLQKNLKDRNFSDIDLRNSALSSAEGEVEFISDGGFGGKLSSMQTQTAIKVKTELLSKYMNRKVDFLKIDIEGSEIDVIKECRQKLNMVDNLFIEYHSPAENGQELDILLEILSQQSFRYHIKSIETAPHPFISRPLIANYDNLVEIYAKRIV